MRLTQGRMMSSTTQITMGVCVVPTSKIDKIFSQFGITRAFDLQTKISHVIQQLTQGRNFIRQKLKNFLELTVQMINAVELQDRSLARSWSHKLSSALTAQKISFCHLLHEYWAYCLSDSVCILSS